MIVGAEGKGVVGEVSCVGTGYTKTDFKDVERYGEQGIVDNKAGNEESNIEVLPAAVLKHHGPDVKSQQKQAGIARNAVHDL